MMKNIIFGCVPQACGGDAVEAVAVGEGDVEGVGHGGSPDASGDVGYLEVMRVDCKMP